MRHKVYKPLAESDGGQFMVFHKIVHKSYQCEEFRVNCFARLLLTQTLERTKNTKPKNISAFNSKLNII